MDFPRTPVRSGKELYQLIDTLNKQFALEIPNPRIYSPSTARDDKSLRWRSYRGIQRLYYDRNVDLNRILNSFDEWVSSQTAPPLVNNARKRVANNLLLDGGRGLLSRQDGNERLRYFVKLIDDELYLLGKGSFVSHLGENEQQPLVEQPAIECRKRRLSSEDDEFYTAPNSPVKNADSSHSPPPGTDEFQNLTIEHVAGELDADTAVDSLARVFKTPKSTETTKAPSKFLEKLTAPGNFRQYDPVPSAKTKPEFSFTSTTTVPNTSINTSLSRFDTSFTSTVTDATDPITDSDSLYEDSVVSHLLSQEMRMTLEAQQSFNEGSFQAPRYSYEGEIMNELLQNGPFALDHKFPGTVPLRYRYELERIGRSWNVPLDRMLVGNNISFKSRDDFWKWIERHNQRGANPLPEKPSSRAWDAATGSFRTDKHSEVVVLTGDLDWCSDSEPGILKLSLNPLKAERTCRFHRRFGSDRFLSLTIPAPARPPPYLRLPAQPSLLRESLALWLTQNVHRCLGRIWKPFFVEEVKMKRKAMAEPRFRVEFFAIDGVDFDHTPDPPLIALKQESTGHTPMALDPLIQWHMPADPNIGQSNCKLFQRISLGLSKTFATVTVRPKQVLHLKDIPNRPVMNDGCALMSRSLANQICDSLGITGNTPSCFQGRIAGAKGLWMVDKHQSQASPGGDDIWIQISDSQLKIKPHPQTWQDPVDEEQLTFEVVKWSKHLHPVDLNTQLLAILEHGGPVKERIAELTRASIRAVYQDFAEVLKSDSPVLCRSLIQKIRPVADDSTRLALHKARRLDQWTASDAETLIRLTEAGFTPRSFYPLRKRLGKCLRDVLDRRVEELHIEVPLSTYAFCIADPYGVLKEDEIHFGFSNNWQDAQGQFEDNLLDGMDVLVGRLPAHLPSDIQRRKAVWKPELRHFKDVIVFPTAGQIPLAHMLSGGDYDGDTPWICWDQGIVQAFANSDLPAEEKPPEHFGLTKHSVPMEQIHSVDEFLQSAFTFNLTLSNLGRCTIEHEKIAYDESIDSHSAKELACLLSHLVDGRKGGVHLSEHAWQQYRKKISPKARELPAYKNPDRKPKKTNIIDYLRFDVARKERHAVLKQLESLFPESDHSCNRDEDLIGPWNEACKQAEKESKSGQLHDVLKRVVNEVEELYSQWTRSFSSEGSFSVLALDIAGRARTILPPSTGDHPMIHLWQNSRDAWLQLIASYTYKKHPHSGFWIHAFGETLCQVKTNSVPSRPVTHEILACYRVNHKVIARLTAQDTVEEEEDDEDEYEGQEAIDAMLYGTQASGAYYDPDDGASLE
ncbi:RNA dependent RNA polymerase [Aspergillus tanneri]|nr:uncharacterized protein ATNIH1004_005696 [Aspergillus tanneri]KAA8647013.1 hypothetical protein ATNIH1004_005696 [Aspergillus tanneri]